MKHTKLAISIPTADRPKNVREYLEMIADATLKADISIYIYDGSEGNATSKVVEYFINKGYSHIYYSHRPDQKYDSRRSYDALMEPDTDYIWLCGDKLLIRPDNYSLILECISQNYDVIALCDKGNGIKRYKRPEEMLGECMWFMTHFGTVIIRKDLIKNYTLDWFVQGKSNAFYQIRLYANAMDKDSFKGIKLHFERSNLKKISKYNTRSGTESRIWSVWIQGWYETINDFPKRYNRYKKEIILSAGKNIETLTLKGFFKYGEQTNLKNFWEFKRYLSSTTEVPVFLIFLIACLPNGLKKIVYYIITNCEE